MLEGFLGEVRGVEGHGILNNGLAIRLVRLDYIFHLCFAWDLKTMHHKLSRFLHV